ncbi:hypothetical protein [Deinococcus peraridilitoris]|uniref:hypothetical protein n=1 Tax=Deinococcus peraridilitoris TaxID=432329 RepID=UPI0012FC6C18|nr:hypothetical protein [Deinococcus peraridilitoris]
MSHSLPERQLSVSGPRVARLSVGELDGSSSHSVRQQRNFRTSNPDIEPQLGMTNRLDLSKRRPYRVGVR